MEEFENINTKRAKNKIGRITLFLATYTIALGAIALCAQSKYDNLKMNYERYGNLENGDLPTAEYLGTSVVDPEIIETSEGNIMVGPEGYVYESDINKYVKDVYKNTKAEAEQERKDMIDYGAAALGTVILGSAAVTKLPKREDLMGTNPVGSEEEKEKTR